MAFKLNIKREICGKCAKTVYSEEEVAAVGKKWHKACFRCHGDGCSISLDLKNFKGHEGKVYCAAHVPKPKATVVADDVMTEHARNAPKKATEGSGAAHRGAAGSERKAPPGSATASSSTPAPKATPTPAPVEHHAPEPTPEPEAAPVEHHEAPAEHHEPAAEETPAPVEEAPHHVEHTEEQPVEHHEAPAEHHEEAPPQEEAPPAEEVPAPEE